MISVYRDPKGEKVIVESFSASNQADMTKVEGLSNSKMENTAALKARVNELEAKLAEVSVCLYYNI